MYTEDFILRQINIAVAILRYLLRMKQAGQHQEALQAVDQALETLMGLRANLLKQLDDDKLLNMLTIQDELDTERLALVAEFYKEEGEILALQDQQARALGAYQRALRFYLEVALNDPSQRGPMLMAKIQEMQSKADSSELPVETQMALLDYLERLRGKTDKELQAGGISRPVLDADISYLETELKHSIE